MSGETDSAERERNLQAKSAPRSQRKSVEIAKAKARLKEYTDLRPTLNPDIGGRRTLPTPTLDQYDRSPNE